MPATIHFKNKKTEEVYGPHAGKTIADLDNLIAEQFGFPVNPDQWCSPWQTMICPGLAFNMSEEELLEAFEDQETHFPGWAERYKVPATFEWLKENFYIRNDWARDSKIKNLGEPAKKARTKAGTKAR